MNLNPDEKELLESFERGEWKPVDADEIARTREITHIDEPDPHTDLAPHRAVQSRRCH